jgi:hypothetical protein
MTKPVNQILRGALAPPRLLQKRIDMSLLLPSAIPGQLIAHRGTTSSCLPRRYRADARGHYPPLLEAQPRAGAGAETDLGRRSRNSERGGRYSEPALAARQSQTCGDLFLDLRVISPFLTGCIRRTYAAIFSFMAGVMPPMPMFGRSLLYVQSHCVA